MMNRFGHDPAKVTRTVSRGTLVFPILLLGGCGRAPSINIVGSFFPTWILCIVLGILFAAGIRALGLYLRVEQHLQPPILIYPSLAASFALTLWLICFS
jgi:hypothetical protein